MMPDETQSDSLDRPPLEMLDFVRDLIRQDCHERQSRRHALVMEVPAVPLDEQFQPCGAPFVAVSRNLSTHGASLVHTARIHAPWLRLKIAGNDLSAVLHAKVLRCHQLRRYFELGCEFVSRVDCGPCVDLGFLAGHSSAL